MQRTNKKQQQKIALERIKILFEEADQIFKDDPKLSNRYIKLARKLAMRVNIRLNKDLKRKFCKHCYYFLKPGINCRIRTRENKLIYYCFNCKNYMRFPFGKIRTS